LGLTEQELASSAPYRPTKGEFQNALDDHELWLKSEGASGSPLSMDKADLTGVNLSGLNIRQCILTNANCEAADMGSTIADDSNFGGARFAHATLNESSFINTNFSEVALDGCKVHHCDFTASSFEDSSLTDAVVEYSMLDALHAYRINCTDSVFRRCSMADTKFGSGTFADAKLYECVLSQASFWGANIERASFEGSRIGGATFLEAKGSGASFRRVLIATPDLISTVVKARVSDPQLGPTAAFNAAELDNAVFDQAQIPCATFANARARFASFRDGDFRYTTWKGADIRGADFRGSLLEGTDFSDAKTDGIKWPEGYDPSAGTELSRSAMRDQFCQEWQRRYGQPCQIVDDSGPGLGESVNKRGERQYRALCVSPNAKSHPEHNFDPEIWGYTEGSGYIGQ